MFIDILQSVFSCFSLLVVLVFLFVNCFTTLLKTMNTFTSSQAKRLNSFTSSHL